MRRPRHPHKSKLGASRNSAINLNERRCHVTGDSICNTCWILAISVISFSCQNHTKKCVLSFRFSCVSFGTDAPQKCNESLTLSRRLKNAYQNIWDEFKSFNRDSVNRNDFSFHIFLFVRNGSEPAGPPMKLDARRPNCLCGKLIIIGRHSRREAQRKRKDQ